MKNFFRCLLFFALAITLISGVAQSVFAESPQGPSATVMPKEDSGAEDNKIFINQFLFSLYNGLVDQGYINDARLANPNDLWNRDFHNFTAGLQRLSGGGFVTPARYYSSDETPYIYYGGSEEDNLFAVFTRSNETFYVGKRLPILPGTCEIQNVDQTTTDLGIRISVNVQCQYVRFLSATYRALSEPKPLFDSEYVSHSSGVGQILIEYLDSLVSRGLVSNYSLDLDTGSSFVEAFPGADGVRNVPIALEPNMVNHFTAQEEALIGERKLRELSADFFAYFNSESIEASPFIFSKEAILSANNAVIELTGEVQPNQRQAEFFASLIGSQEPNLNALTAPNCTELTGDIDNYYAPGSPGEISLYTPYNNCMTFLRGWDRLAGPGGGLWGAHMYESLVQPIEKFGYVSKNFVVDPTRSIHSQFPISGAISLKPSNFGALVTSLKESQTLALETHGMSDGGNVLMCLKDKYGSNECCNVMKNMAQSFGFDVSGIDCTLRYPPTLIGNVIKSRPSGANGGCDPSDAAQDRCVIFLNSGFWDYIGVKAAAFTAQCYGGACGGDLSHLDRRVGDYFAGFINDVNTASINHDFQLLKTDLTGKSKRKIDCITPPTGPIPEPTSPYCTTPPYGFDTMFGMNMHAIESTVEVRGVGGKIWGDGSCTAHNNYFNGAEQFCYAHLGGRERAGIEFVPVVLDAGFQPDSSWFYMAYSSPVEKSTGSISVDDSACKPRLSSDVHPDHQSLESDAAYVDLQGYPIMDAALWGNPAEIQRRYGRARTSDWQYKLRVKLSGVKAHNGVSLDGNGTAAQKWLWPFEPSTVPPWSNVTGVAPNNDDLVIDIPCAPPIQCCIPHLETQRTGRTSCQWIQNGCECTQVASIEDCYSVPPLHTCSNPEQRFEGSPCINASCCDRAPQTVPGAPPNPGICDAYTEEVEACPWLWCYDPNRPVPTRTNRTNHFRDWSMDQNGDQDCGKIIGHCPECGEE